MTIATLCLPIAYLFSKETILTPVGSNAPTVRTPLAGAAFAYLKGRAGSGAAQMTQAQTGDVAISGAGAFGECLIDLSLISQFQVYACRGAPANGGSSAAYSTLQITPIGANAKTALLLGGGGSVINSHYSYYGQSDIAYGGAGGIDGGQGYYSIDGAEAGQYEALGANTNGNGTGSPSSGVNSVAGGYGLYRGGSGPAAGGGNSVIGSDAALSHLTVEGGLRGSTPRSGDADLGSYGAAVAALAGSTTAYPGAPGIWVIEWYSGDPYAAGLLV